MSIPRIKKELSLISVIRQSIKLNKTGESHFGLCPFHKDKNPSLDVSAEKNLWYCHGCGRGGSIIDWVIHWENVSLGEAIRILAQRYPQFVEQEQDHFGKAEPILAEETESIPQPQETLQDVIKYYHPELVKTDSASNYILGRGISPEALEEFNIGYCDNSLEKMLSDYGYEQESPEEFYQKLQSLNLIIENYGYIEERFSGFLVFPVYDKNANITELYGRSIKEKSSYRNHKYLPGKHRGFFNSRFFYKNKPQTIILCESIIDALSFWSYGFTNVTASFGANGFSEDLRDFVINHVKKIYLAYDNDQAGNNAAYKLQKELSVYQIHCLRIEFPTGQDANEFINKTKTPQEDLNRLIQAAYTYTEKAA